MSFSQNSLKAGYLGDDIGEYLGVIKGILGSLDYNSCSGPLLM